ncbi:GTP-binding protein [Demequina sp. NBRC 110053]|uniref:GTP-binding protein n=1 Tax=Demequina sp. NBRC 110053 TaxID=1570342 RepID=UPI000A07A00A|nr:GTP-binding protein [Demequina sp. NBRC 110053]
MTDMFTISTLATIDPVVRASATLGLTLDRADTVVITHDILEGGVRRTVADASGVLETTITPLAHACVSCAIREDVLPTLVGLRRRDAWQHAVVALPVTAEPAPLVRLLDAALSPDGSLAGAAFGTVTAVVDGTHLHDDAFSDQWLSDVGRALHEDDDRVVAEALAPILAAADLIVMSGDQPICEEAFAVADHLRGDGARVIGAALSELSAVMLGRAHGRGKDCLERADPLRPPRRTPRDRAGVWTLRLSSDRPFDAGRLRENLHRLADHRVRARGHFWIASRPGAACIWEEAGGQLSVGEVGTWEGRRPRTEILVTGMGDERDTIAQAFAAALSSPADAPSEDRLDDWFGEADGSEADAA